MPSKVRARPTGGVYVYKRKRGELVRWVVERRRGTGLPKSYKVLDTRAEAEEYATKLRGEIAAEEANASSGIESKITLEDAWHSYVRHAERTLRPGTLETYRGAMEKHVLPALGHLTLQHLDRERIRTFIRESLTAGMHPKTVKNAVGSLRSCLASLVADGVLPSNPASIMRGWLPTNPPRPKSLTKAQLHDFLQASQGEPYEDLILFLALTGVRLGEALALRWEDVHLEERMAAIKRSVRLREESMPKTRFGIRSVDLAKPVVAMLQRRLEAAGPAPRLVFPGVRSGSYIDARHLHHAFKRIAKRAGIPKVHPHMLRHTWATTLLNAGAPLNYVSRALGHHSTAFTAGVYATAHPDPRPQDVDALAASALGEESLRSTLGDAAGPVLDDKPIKG